MSAQTRAGARDWAVLLVLCVSLLVVALDNTILNVALPTLVKDLHATDSQLQWIVDGYTIVFAGLLITFGSLGDRFGRRGALLLGLLLFGAGSALSAFSGSADELILFRSFMGVGGALVMPSTLSLLTNVFTNPTQRARAIGLWSATSGLGVAIGPIIGGWLLSNFWWGSVFLVNAPIVVGGFIAVLLVVPTSKDPAARRADPPGVVLSIAGLGVLLWKIIDAPVDGWAHSTVLLALAGGTTLLALFVVWELHTRHPMFRMQFFDNPRFSAASVSVSLVFFALFGSLFLLTQYLQSIMGYSPLQAGLRIAPVALTLAAAAPLASLAVERVGTKIVVVAGLCIAAGGLAVASRLTVHSSYLWVLIALLVSGAGMGTTMAPATEAIMGSLPPNEAGVGSAMNGTNLQVGGALGVAILGSLLNQHYRAGLLPAVQAVHLPTQLAHTAASSLGGALAVAQRLPAPAGSVLARSASTAFVGGLELASLAAMGIALGGALVALLFLPARGREDVTTATMSPRGHHAEAA